MADTLSQAVSQSGGIVMFERAEGGAKLVEMVRNTQTPSHSSVCCRSV